MLGLVVVGAYLHDVFAQERGPDSLEIILRDGDVGRRLSGNAEQRSSPQAHQGDDLPPHFFAMAAGEQEEDAAEGRCSPRATIVVRATSLSTRGNQHGARRRSMNTTQITTKGIFGACTTEVCQGL